MKCILPPTESDARGLSKSLAQVKDSLHSHLEPKTLWSVSPCSLEPSGRFGGCLDPSWRLRLPQVHDGWLRPPKATSCFPVWAVPFLAGDWAPESPYLSLAGGHSRRAPSRAPMKGSFTEAGTICFVQCGNPGHLGVCLEHNG